MCSKFVLTDQHFKALRFLSIRTAVMVVLPHAVSRTATSLGSSLITCRHLDEVQALSCNSNIIAKCRILELADYINTF